MTAPTPTEAERERLAYGEWAVTSVQSYAKAGYHDAHRAGWEAGQAALREEIALWMEAESTVYRPNGTGLILRALASGIREGSVPT